MLKSIGINVGSNLASASSKILFYSIYSRTVDVDSFASFAFSVLFVEFAATILQIGDASATIIEARKFKRARHLYYQSIFQSKLLTLSAVALISLIFLDVIYVLAALSLVVFEYQNSLLQSDYKFSSILAREVFCAVVRVFIVVSLSYGQFASAGHIWLYFSPIILTATLDAISLVTKALRTGGIRVAHIRSALKRYVSLQAVGKEIFMQQALAIVLRRGDVFYIYLLLGEVEAGMFGALLVITNFVPLLNNAIRRVLLPSVMDSDGLNMSLKRHSRRLVTVSYAMSAVFALVLLNVYKRIYDVDVLLEDVVAYIVIFSIFSNMAFAPLQMPLYKQGRIREIVHIHFYQILIQTITSIVCIYTFGLIGAAISLLVVRVFGIEKLLRKYKNGADLGNMAL